MNIERLNVFAPAFALAVFTLGAAPAGPMSAVSQFVDGFNKGSIETMSSACSNATGIIDDFPPHAWMSCNEWYKAFVAFSKEDGDTDAVVTLGIPAHVDVTGKLAYVVVPTTYTFKHHGKTVVQSGSTWTLVVKNTSAGWRITDWAWADGK